jgi:predicted TIM-barrel fold metal-dependent hydrolase
MSQIIDVHHHWIPPLQVQTLQMMALPGQSVRELRPGTMGIARGNSILFLYNEKISSVERLIANLDRCGIDKVVLSVANWIEWLDLEMCREVNDAMHELRQRLPERVLTLAHVPIGEEGALDELERAASLGVAGVYSIVHLSRKGWSLDHPGLDSFYELVNALDLPIITHPACEPLEYVPTTPTARLPLSDYNLLMCYGRPYNTTVSFLRVLLSDVLDRFPRLRFIYPHLGGSFGVMKERLLSRYFDVGLRETLEQRLQRMFFDTAPPRWAKPELRCAIETLGIDHIMFGSDHPIEDNYLDHAVRLIESEWFTNEERQQICHRNARHFFKLK